jgi:hypothetical protein
MRNYRRKTTRSENNWRIERNGVEDNGAIEKGGAVGLFCSAN